MTFLSATWTLSGYDVAAHVAEETSHAAITVPRAMVWSTWSSAALGFIYLIALALCSTDIDALMANPLGQPIGTLTANILGTKAGVGLLAINFFAQFGCGVAFVSSSAVFSSVCIILTYFAPSSSPPAVSSSPTLVTRLSLSQTGLARLTSARTHPTTLHSSSSSSPRASGPSPSALTPHLRLSSPAAHSPDRSRTFCLSSAGACTRTTLITGLDRTILGGGQRLSGGWPLRGTSSSCRWSACKLLPICIRFKALTWLTM